MKYVTRFLRSPIATLHSLIQDNRILLDTPKNVPIFLHMQTESKSSQPFVPVQLNGIPLNELDAKQKSSDGIISWWSHFFKYWNTYLDLDSNSQTFGFHYSLLYWMWYRNSFDHNLEGSYTHHCYCMLLPIHHIVLLWCNMWTDHCSWIHYIPVLDLFIV